MDPRHPEQAISRMRELMKQYDRVEADIRTASVATKLGALEREGALVIQELCLVAPRLHEAMMQTSRQRRHDLSRGVVDLGIRAQYEQPFEPVEKPVEKSEGYTEMAEVLDHSMTKEQEQVFEEVTKPKKKIARKKKTTKKAEE